MNIPRDILNEIFNNFSTIYMLDIYNENLNEDTRFYGSMDRLNQFIEEYTISSIINKSCGRWAFNELMKLFDINEDDPDIKSKLKSLSISNNLNKFGKWLDNDYILIDSEMEFYITKINLYYVIPKYCNNIEVLEKNSMFKHVYILSEIIQDGYWNHKKIIGAYTNNNLIYRAIDDQIIKIISNKLYYEKLKSALFNMFQISDISILKDVNISKKFGHWYNDYIYKNKHCYDFEVYQLYYEEGKDMIGNYPKIEIKYKIQKFAIIYYKKIDIK